MFSCCTAAIPHMREAGGGVIVNMSSSLGVEGAARLAAYTSSKAAVIQLTRSLAIEYLLDGIRVNAVLMAGVDSEASRRVHEGFKRSVVGDDVPPGGPTQVSTVRGLIRQDGAAVARSIALLCADDAASITGATVAMDRCVSAGILTSTALARMAAGVWR
jgi:NAD(P)-dependent dehydrogenase (short-subunit alcohol dehydrogenase family)